MNRNQTSSMVYRQYAMTEVSSFLKSKFYVIEKKRSQE